MCRAITCSTCGKTTWAGCGKHVSQVMAGVPEDQRCPGHPKGPSDKVPFLGRLLGRRRSGQGAPA
ncbi:MAG: hypothetical protein ACRDZX_06210 [Acidimicrobiales bacterium]